MKIILKIKYLIIAIYVYSTATLAMLDENMIHVNKNLKSFNQRALFIDNEIKKGLSFQGETYVVMSNNAQLTDSVVNNHAKIYLVGKNQSIPFSSRVQNLTINDRGGLQMDAGSRALGTLEIANNARLIIANVDAERFTDQQFDMTPPPPFFSADVFIDRLNLAGTALIAPLELTTYVDANSPLDQPINTLRQIGVRQQVYHPVSGPELTTKIDTLQMKEGSLINFRHPHSTQQFNHLVIKRLTGHGHFFLESHLSGQASDQITVTEWASGQFGLHIADSGISQGHPGPVVLLITHAGNAQFRLLNPQGIVEIGPWQYRLRKHATQQKTEWLLDPYQSAANDEIHQPSAKLSQSSYQGTSADQIRISNSANAILTQADATLTSLTQSMPDFHQRIKQRQRNEQGVSAWVRHLDNKSHTLNRVDRRQDNRLYGVQVGGDYTFPWGDGALSLGLMTSQTKMVLNAKRAHRGSTSSQGFGGYASWLATSGFYVDTAFKRDRLEHALQTRMLSGSIANGEYQQWAHSATAEIGKIFSLNTALSITPYAKMGYFHTTKAQYRLTNNMATTLLPATLWQSEWGIQIAGNYFIANRPIHPYFKGALIRTINHSNPAVINGATFNAAMVSRSAHYGVGLRGDLTDNISAYGQLDYQSGSTFTMPLSISAGIRAFF